MSDAKVNRAGKLWWSPELRGAHRLTEDERRAAANRHVDSRRADAADQRDRHRGRATAPKAR